jgi:O-antigen/teichoic acid export membrane protein
MATVHLLFCLQVARIVQPHITGPHGVERWFVRKMALAYTGITLGLTLGASLLGTVVIVWLLPDFTAALPPLLLLLFGSLMLAFGYVESLYLHRFRRETAILRCYTVGGLVFVGLAVWLIGNWGPIGAGVALVASAGVSAGLMAACLLASAEPGRSSGSSP